MVRGEERNEACDAIQSRFENVSVPLLLYRQGRGLTPRTLSFATSAPAKATEPRLDVREVSKVGS